MAIVLVSEHSSLPSVAADTRAQLQRRRTHMYVHRRGLCCLCLIVMACRVLRSRRGPGEIWLGGAIGSISRISFCKVFDVSSNVVVALSDIFRFRNSVCVGNMDIGHVRSSDRTVGCNCRCLYSTR